MRLGQDYMQWLMTEFHNDGDLGRVFAAYNGGPGWLSRWLATQPADLDPLLLLEMLPRAESRDYAERALSHMALCRKSTASRRQNWIVSLRAGPRSTRHSIAHRVALRCARIERYDLGLEHREPAPADAAHNAASSSISRTPPTSS
jgi:hypothetical protein